MGSRKRYGGTTQNSKRRAVARLWGLLGFNSVTGLCPSELLEATLSHL